nr:mucin-19-like isoform X4 [Megalopta genalis]
MIDRMIVTVLLGLLGLAHGLQCPKQKTSPGREVVCYTSVSDVEQLTNAVCRCTTLVHQGYDVRNLSTSDFDDFRKSLKEIKPPLQFVISVADPAKTLNTSGTVRRETAARLLEILKDVDGLELNATAGTKDRLVDFVKSLKDGLTNASLDRRIFLVLPTNPEDLAKQFDLKRLSKYVDLFTISTHYLVQPDGDYHTFHPSRLMGLFDTFNADSLIDFLTGLGAPKRKILVSVPASAYKFTLKDPDNNAPGSDAEEKQPAVIDRKQFCNSMSNGEWTVERDEDLTAPYAFKNKTWIAHEDKLSITIKGKYVLLRELPGLAIHNIENDFETDCGKPLTHEIHHSFTDFKRKSRAAVLSSLEDDLHQTQLTYPTKVKSSEFRVVRVVDTEGHIRAVRENTQTEFTCSRQGYFVHPKSCNRFYRCVKFNQEVEDYSVFEFDCPAGLSFDERTEVCVWPGSLPQGSPCPGSSEIAPTTRITFECPSTPGYYANPQNPRWFFACMDLGGPEMMAYEFRCPYGLIFDEHKLICEWPWLVPGYTGGEYASTVYDNRGSTQSSGGYYTGSLPHGGQGGVYTGTTAGVGYTGSAGTGGYSGHSGFSGAAGVGYTGSGGYTGAAGTGGYSGATGSGGYSGSAGAGGHAGVTGSGGYSGATGSGGYSGSAGAGGHAGATGSGGYSGPAGAGGHAGVTGSGGYSGATGSGGYSGATGSGGYSGSVGAGGHAGVTGSGGYSGPAGAGGHAGVTGSGGYSGATGSGGYSGGAGSGGYSGGAGSGGYSGATGSGAYSGSTGAGGHAGATGTGGYSGPAGAGGHTGTTVTGGYSGATGSGGYSGGAGTGGYSGPAGAGGHAGTTGSGGYSGGAGTGGYSGSAGAGGHVGTSVTGGYSGATGSGGYPGSAGAGGHLGQSGFSGAGGYTGSTIGGHGSSFGQESTGYTGTTGYVGSKGIGIGGSYSGTTPGGYSGSGGIYGGSTGTGYTGYSGSTNEHTGSDLEYTGATGTGKVSVGSGYAGKGTTVHSGTSGIYSGSAGTGYTRSDQFGQSGYTGGVTTTGGYEESTSGGYAGSTGNVHGGPGGVGFEGSTGGYSGATGTVHGGAGTGGYKGSIGGGYGGSTGTGYSGSTTTIHGGAGGYKGTIGGGSGGVTIGGYPGSTVTIHGGAGGYEGTVGGGAGGVTGGGYAGSTIHGGAGGYEGTVGGGAGGVTGGGYAGSTIHGGAGGYEGTVGGGAGGVTGGGYAGSTIHGGAGGYEGTVGGGAGGVTGGGYAGSTIHGGAGGYEGTIGGGAGGVTSGGYGGSTGGGSTGGKDIVHGGSGAGGYEGTGGYTGSTSTHIGSGGFTSGGYAGSSTGAHGGIGYAGTTAGGYEGGTSGGHAGGIGTGFSTGSYATSGIKGGQTGSSSVQFTVPGTQYTGSNFGGSQTGTGQTIIYGTRHPQPGIYDTAGTIGGGIGYTGGVQGHTSGTSYDQKSDKPTVNCITNCVSTAQLPGQIYTTGGYGGSSGVFQGQKGVTTTYFGSTGSQGYDQGIVGTGTTVYQGGSGYTGGYYGPGSTGGLNLTYHVFGKPSVDYGVTGTPGTILTGSNIPGSVITGDSSPGTVIAYGETPGTIISGSVDQGTIVTGGVQPGYVKTSTGTPGYVVGGGVKTVYTGPGGPGTAVYGTPGPGVVLTGTQAPGTILKGQPTPGIVFTGQTAPGIVLTGQTAPGVSLHGPVGSTGIHVITDSGYPQGGVGVTPAYGTKIGASPGQDTGYKTNEYHDNGGRGTIKFNNGDVTTKYTENDIPDYRPGGSEIPPDTLIPGYNVAGSGQPVSTGFTKTGPTKTGITTASLGGRGSYVISAGQTRPTLKPDAIGEKAFDGNVAGFTKSSTESSIFQSTQPLDVNYVDTSKIASVPTKTGYTYPRPSIPFETGVKKPVGSLTESGVLTGTTPTPFLNVEVYNSPKLFGPTVTPEVGTYTSSTEGYYPGKVPSGFTRGPTPTSTPILYTTGSVDGYKSTLFEAAKMPVTPTVRPLFDNGYQTVVSSTPIPITVTKNQFEGGIQTGSVSSQTQFDYGRRTSQQGGLVQNGYVSSTTQPSVFGVPSTYSISKPRPFGPAATVTEQPEINYVSSTSSGSGYFDSKSSFGHRVTSSDISKPQTQYLPSQPTSPAFGVTYTRPFPDIGYQQSTPIPPTGSPTNVEISRNEVDKLVTNYRGTTKYVPSQYDIYNQGVSGADVSRTQASSGLSYGSTPTLFGKTQSSFSGGYPRPTSVVSYETTAKTTAVGKAKVIVKWSDLHPLLLGKLGAECTCRGDPFANLRGPGSRLIDSSKGKVDLGNYDDSEIYVDLDRDGSYEDGDYDTTHPGPVKLLPLETPAPTETATIQEPPSSTYLPSVKSSFNVGLRGSVPPSPSLSHGFSANFRSGKSLSNAGPATNSVGKGASFDRYGPGGLRDSEEVLEGATNCARPGLFRHPNFCNKFYACHWDEWKKRFTLHVFNCPVHLTFDNGVSACNWPSMGPACQDDNLLV